MTPERQEKSDWLKPSTILAVVMSAATFASMWSSFDQRVTRNENNIAALNERLSATKTDTDKRLDRIEGKLDRLIEGAKHP